MSSFTTPEWPVIDSRGKRCPIPIFELAAALAATGQGEQVVSRASDPAFPADLRAFCDSTGHVLERLDEPSPGEFSAHVRKGLRQD